MYKKISDYGIIGDMHSLALISKEGSIDYCSMPHIDSPTVFAALLDDEKGGYFKIQPRGEFKSEQEYVEDTNILRCIFATDTARAELLDFMPLSQDDLFEGKEHIIHRCLRVTDGSLEFVLRCVPRPGYASASPDIEQKDKVFYIKDSEAGYTLIAGLEEVEIEKTDQSEIIINFSLKGGEEAHFSFLYGHRTSDEIKSCYFAGTKEFWTGWLHNCIAGSCPSLGEYSGIINRSLLALKLLTFQSTGAIAAAATTSLPEVVGGQRNWDYRFTWIRDASFTLKALFALGHIAEADGFIKWLHNTYQRYGSRDLQIMYSLKGESNLTEKTLRHLKGYMNSRPVRVGNSAFKQNQWDIYGEVMDAALRLSDYAGKIDENLWPFFKDICNLAARDWQKPDDGIWEVRNGPYHFVYSKVMCWVAIDRGVKIARRYGLDAPFDSWEKEQRRIREDVLKKGYDNKLKSFVQRYGSKDLDSSVLMLALMDFLPVSDEQMKETINTCERHLMKKGFLMRYEAEDGLEGEEGAFLLCNFWMIECFALLGNIDKAKKLLNNTLKASNHLGLFSEEYDYKGAVMLGNFPQAFSHIGLINAVWSILSAESKITQSKKGADWSQRMRKLVPFKVVLNKSDGDGGQTSEKIAEQLKITLNNLQGSFFDVERGRVNYARMKRSESYNNYLELSYKLNLFDPFTLKTDEEKKAFWINIYNILIIHGVIEFDINNSVKEVFNFFRRIGYSIGAKFFTPDDIEHGILRANAPHPVSSLREFSRFDKRKTLAVKRLDPRIHFALVCASSSCPPIEFYDSDQIDKQLDVAGRSFINRRGLILEKDKNAVHLSQIFKWYSLDFGRAEKEVVEYAASFANEAVSDYVIRNIKTIKVRYLPYDWNLNRVLE
jgi:GH15 family glucan-1,4-alpha-glucosidase